MSYKLAFKGSENVIENYSQASQDIFVLMCLDGKINGTFLDLGCSNPIEINNTYLLEKQFGWQGLSIDIDEDAVKKYAQLRETKALVRDCTKIDFNEILSYYKTNHIDYLSLDLEPASITYDCLERIPFDKVEFSVITFEHDFYRFGEKVRTNSREIFEKNNYYRICSNVATGGCIYEDWYINLKYVDIERIKILESESLDFTNILYKE